MSIFFHTYIFSITLTTHTLYIYINTYMHTWFYTIDMYTNVAHPSPLLPYKLDERFEDRKNRRTSIGCTAKGLYLVLLLFIYKINRTFSNIRCCISGKKIYNFFLVSRNFLHISIYIYIYKKIDF